MWHGNLGHKSPPVSAMWRQTAVEKETGEKQAVPQPENRHNPLTARIVSVREMDSDNSGKGG
jgi:hypothetical protein